MNQKPGFMIGGLLEIAQFFKDNSDGALINDPVQI